MTPPPVPRLNDTSRTSSQNFQMSSSFETTRRIGSVATTTDSHYSDDEEHDDADFRDDMGRRPSTNLSMFVSSGRPSLSDYSQPSPTASAFMDALNEPYMSSSSQHQQEIRSRATPSPRYSTVSPPPRVSSSLANVALSPPPRPRSMRRAAMQMASSDPGHSASSSIAQRIRSPSPVTPPIPLADRRGHGTATSLSLQIPVGPVPISVHSAPPPSSPTAFFDQVQSQHNAMDDLDSDSDSDSDNEDDTAHISPRPNLISIVPSASTSGSTLMRLGNRSLPYVGRFREERRPSLPFGASDPRRPIGKLPMRAPVSNNPLPSPVGNIPFRGPVFAERRSGDYGIGHSRPSFDFHQYTRDHPTGPTLEAQRLGRPSPSENVRVWQTNQRAQESLRRLDGMLVQHMEAEKDTIKRIATSTLHTKTQTDITAIS
jgi:hypothetical protein